MKPTCRKLRGDSAKLLTDLGTQRVNGIKLDRTLKFLGLTSFRNEPALYYMRRNHQIKGILVSHVDDLLYAGDSDFDRAMNRLDQYIKIQKKAEKEFKFCGFSICTCNNSDIHFGVELSKHNSLCPTEILAPAVGRRMLERRNDEIKNRYSPVVRVTYKSRFELRFGRDAV